MKITVTGATGLIGKALCIKLSQLQHEVTGIVRNPGTADFLDPKQVFKWSDLDSAEASSLITLKSTEVLIHLAGEPVAGARWTDQQKKAILDSRIETTEALIRALEKLQPSERPKVFIAASAIGYYGDQKGGSNPNEILAESSPKGPGFLADVTARWEDSILKAQKLGMRVVILRTGIVLSRLGGALSKMLPVILGSGNQWMSWIHLEDEIGFIEFALNNSHVQGIYNLTAPEPVTNRTFCELLAKAIQFPVVTQTPEAALRVALGEMADVVLSSQRVLPTKALADGYTFKYKQLDSALKELFPDQSNLSQVFHAAQFIPRPINEVFTYFSEAKNLEKITPPWLNFKITGQSTPEIQNKTQIYYKLSIHGVPVRWQTSIERWEPGVRFIDTQVKGPYKKWVHEHQFFAVPGGTLMLDHVTFQIPGRSLGKFILGPWIKGDIQKIFHYRKKIIQETFKN